MMHAATMSLLLYWIYVYLEPVHDPCCFSNSLLGYTEQYVEYDPFLTPPDPSNPWITDDTTLWELEARFVHKKHSVYT